MIQVVVKIKNLKLDMASETTRGILSSHITVLTGHRLNDDTA